ncbi:MAG TPA: hypothetical protein VGD72_05655 [Mycobacteriales bacterium]
MLDQVNGIPSHALFVHAPLVLISLTLLLGLVYVVVPALRPRIDWALVLFAVAGPVTALLATLSGERLEARIGASPAIDHHASLGELARNLSAVLLVAVLLLVGVDRLRARSRRRARALAEGDDPAAPARPAGGAWTVLSVVLSLVLLGVGAATGTYLVLAGDTGAHMVWAP